MEKNRNAANIITLRVVQHSHSTWDPKKSHHAQSLNELIYTNCQSRACYILLYTKHSQAIVACIILTDDNHQYMDERLLVNANTNVPIICIYRQTDIWSLFFSQPRKHSFLVLAVLVLTRDNNDSTIEMDFQNNNGLSKGTHLTIERRGLRPVLSVKYLVFRIGCLHK